jgi:hypothetical protein
MPEASGKRCKRDDGNMIDLQSETVLSLTDAAKLLPRLRRGKRPHVSTLYRWANKGIRGVRLETIRVGGTVCTSQDALRRFCDHLSHPEQHGPPLTPRTPPVHAVEKELDDLGF